MPTTDINLDLDVRPLREGDLDAADRRHATCVRYVHWTSGARDIHGRRRFRAHALANRSVRRVCGRALPAEIVGSNFATQWGSVGFFGPLTIRPDLWDRGIGQRLMEPVMDCFARWQTTHTGLFTFAHSQKHLALYQRFGFWPRFLTAVMSKAGQRNRHAPTYSRFSDLADNERHSALAACRDLTNALFDGLDVTREICAVADQALGDTVLLWDDSTLVGVAICHCGAGSEAGGGTCYVKFGAVRPGPGAESYFSAAAGCRRATWPIRADCLVWSPG